jgi:hypothetical protein
MSAKFFVLFLHVPLYWTATFITFSFKARVSTAPQC